MIYSMTGYASAQREWPQGVLLVELRAVNHRFLDASLRLPEEFRPLESAIREKIAAKLSRGKVECRIAFNAQQGADSASLQLNRKLAESLLQLGQELSSFAPEARPLSIGEVLRWPGVLATDALPPETLQAAALELLDAALVDFIANRGREGEKLAALLTDRATQMQTLVEGIKPRLPQIVADYEARLTQRLQDALGSHDEERIRQEIVLFAQRIDVAEELDRLVTHLDELRHILKKGGVVGKRLDFLMQELNREANTLGSKSVAVDSSRVSMELKVLIEQMREQVQNIE
ncbi:TIGR00255 family protein [Formivibrio citricus]|uniref:TIGR00255 family protein n=1 Tax=Formivibrio citricus TaxID=83765 RepID=A0A1I5CA04_9NEIS|nr:YicC/YloC family endoribonuclease [Formivibrio citricus]SFN83875.1 TIGR00255 family protein [Formivibrio citricus]